MFSYCAYYINSNTFSYIAIPTYKKYKRNDKRHWDTLKPRTHDQGFLDTFSLDKFFLDKEPCSLEEGKLFVFTADKENLTSNWNQHHEMTRVVAKFVQSYTRANKTCQEKTCSLYTQASTATKELLKENLVVCAGLNLTVLVSHIRIISTHRSICSAIWVLVAQ